MGEGASSCGDDSQRKEIAAWKAETRNALESLKAEHAAELTKLRREQEAMRIRLAEAETELGLYRKLEGQKLRASQ